MKQSIKILIFVVVLVVVFSAGYLYIQEKQSKEAVSLIFNSLVSIVNNFHKDIGELSPTQPDRSSAQKELSKMKKIAEEANDSLQDLLERTYAINTNDSFKVRKTIESTQDYLSSFSKMAGQTILPESLKIASEELNQQFSLCQKDLGYVDCPKRQKVFDATARAILLVKNFKNRKNPIPETVIVTQSLPVNTYWANERYSDYRDKLVSIITRYSQGRSILSRVLSHYDAGNFGDRDRLDWITELQKRKGFLVELSTLQSSIPPGSIYMEHHNMLRIMLESAIPILERFEENPCSRTREAVHLMSSDNTRIMNKLKAFYGVR